MTEQELERVMRKFSTVLRLIETGQIGVEPLELAKMAVIAKDAGELALARRAERIVRRLLPAWQRDLT